jgi:hypothetical protein
MMVRSGTIQASPAWGLGCPDEAPNAIALLTTVAAASQSYWDGWPAWDWPQIECLSRRVIAERRSVHVKAGQIMMPNRMEKTWQDEL